ncbi:SRPBCC family protein [Salinirubellus salinus]|uniref:SRPBCC family protein n=1 Tax=Salinirubellus salinus TaxID=1364945 RepID=A0A9E7R1N3_9EURY|nr:SRPBCC family protein [Salinirubellus salinus]UWM54095.1 SRPBCC family protein [Salinirubellus salinus]
MATLTFERTVAVPHDVAWDVLRDQAAFRDAAPNLSEVDLPEGLAVGAPRRCADTDGRWWDETCTRYDPGRAYAFAVDAPNSPVHRRLFRSFGGTFEVTPEDGGDRSRVSMQFDYEPRYGPLGRLLVRLGRGRFERVGETTLENLEAEMHERATATA